MKSPFSLPCYRLILAGSMVFASLALSRAEDVIVSQFNDAASLTGWRFDYGGVTNLIEFDGAQDANGNPASGSLKVTFGMDVVLGGNNKGAITIDLPAPLDGSAYMTMQLDVLIEPGSAADSAGNSGNFQMVIRNNDSYDFNSQFYGSVSTNSGWRHISVTPTGGRQRIRALTFELSAGATITGPVIFHLDNVKFTQPDPTHDIIVSQFNDATSRTRWRFDYGGVTNLIVFDPTEDANSNLASGSLKTTFGFNGGTLGDNNKGAITLDLPAPLDGSLYVSMEMDVKVQPGSAEDLFGNNGYLKMVIRNTGSYSFDSQFEDNINTNGGWRHIRATPLTGIFTDIRAITLELFGDPALTGPVTFFIDNLKFTATNPPPLGPTMAVEAPPVRGLNLIPTSGQFQRQNIATIDNLGYSWIGQESVTYSLTIGSYPGAAYPGYQTHIFLVPGAAVTGSAPDYSEPNLIFLDIQASGAGAFASFRYKTNEPGNNVFLYSSGTLGGVSSSSYIGTWSITFSQDTNVLVTAPNGSMNTFTLPAEAAALFADPLTVYVGAQPNGGGNIGQTVVINRFEISSSSALILDSDFVVDQSLGNNVWRVDAGDAQGVVLVAPSAAFWLSWTTPDSGFILQATPAVDSRSLYSLPWTVPLMGSRKRVLVHRFTDTPEAGKAYMPDPNMSFFQLIKP
jgi:hypothetical protein